MNLPAFSIGLVVEDIPDVRHWMAACLARAYPGMRITEACDLRAGRAWLARLDLPPGAAAVALVDLGLTDGSGVDLLRALAQHAGILPIVMTNAADDVTLYAALAAGAQGYLLKEIEEPVLIDRLKGLARGDLPFSPQISRQMLAFFRQGDRPESSGTRLTARETEVLALLGRGLRIGDIASALTLSTHTVADHVKAIYRKLDISSRAEAALEASRRRLL